MSNTFLRMGGIDIVGWACASPECEDVVHILFVIAALFLVGIGMLIVFTGVACVIGAIIFIIGRALGIARIGDQRFVWDEMSPVFPAQPSPLIPYIVASSVFCMFGFLCGVCNGYYNMVLFLATAPALVLAPRASRRTGIALRLGALAAVVCVGMAWGDHVDWLDFFVSMLLYPAVELLAGFGRRHTKQN